MTDRSATSKGDSIRSGLTFTQEVQLLVALRLGIPSDSRLVVDQLRQRLQQVAGWTPHQSARLCSDLVDDLVKAPIRCRLHPEWEEEWLGRVPATMRRLWLQADREDPSNRWLLTQIPLLSARLLRLHEPEPACLALLDPARQELALADLTRAAVRLAYDGLSAREKMAFRPLAGDCVSDRLPAPIERSVQVVTLRCGPKLSHWLYKGLSLVSARAQRPTLLLPRFGTFVLAACFDESHRAEIQAVAIGRPFQEGTALLGLWERRIHIPVDLMDGLHSLLLAILSMARSTAEGAIGDR
ncbi:MAG: hypothetical protein JW797_00885 [Bradymonadales bacterium]|nr:hypothetical protein [Bradymonadales bacterium]